MVAGGQPEISDLCRMMFPTTFLSLTQGEHHFRATSRTPTKEIACRSCPTAYTVRHRSEDSPS